MPRGGARPGAGRTKKEPTEKRVKLSLTMSPAILAELDRIARERGTTRSLLIETIVSQFLVDQVKGN